MDWLQDRLNTTSKVLVLLNGESVNCILYFNFSSARCWLSRLFLAAKMFMPCCFLVDIYRRTVVSIPSGPSALAVKEAAWGLARYAAISQV